MPAFPGDRFQPKARDWNKLKENLPSWQAPSAPPGIIAKLPALTTRLQSINSEVRRPVLGEAVSLYNVGVSADPIEATLPLGDSLTLSSNESRLPSFSCPTYRTLSPVLRSGPQGADLHEPFAICVDPRNMTFAISGLALVRVRFISRWHRFVRRPILLPGDDDAVDGPRLTGCLDSSGHGPGQIVGVMTTDATTAFQSVPWPFMTSSAGYAAPKVIWTLIRW